MLDMARSGYLEQVFEVLPAGVVVLDREGHVRDANLAAKALLGEPLEGMPWCGVIERAFDPRPDDGHEVSLRDGRRLSISTTPLQGTPGQIVLLKDVTETRRLQEKLHHYQRLSSLGAMAASLAHQIRTPLSTAVLYASHLAKEGALMPEQRRFADKILARLFHLEKLVQAMLAFAKGGQFRKEKFEAGEVMASLEEAVESLPGEFVFHRPFPRGFLLGNRDALLSAFQNIVTNALEASGEGARIEIGARRKGDTFEITFADNGPGIDGRRERVFEPFYTTRPQGTGLGLSVVQAVIKAHRGDISVRRHRGGGALFAVTLPLFKEEG